MPKNRDDFSTAVKRLLAARVGHKCSKPDCGAATSGPDRVGEATVSLGDAAHITAAAEGGPRFDSNLTPEERRGYANGIWLCAIHARQVDRDEQGFPVDALRNWKQDAEAKALRNLGRPTEGGHGRLATASAPERIGAQTACMVQGQVIPHVSIVDLADPLHERPTWFVEGFVVQISVRKRENLEYAVVDFVQATIHAFAPVPEYEPIYMAYPAEMSLYFIELDQPTEASAVFRPTHFFKQLPEGKYATLYPSPIVIDSTIPAQLAVRLNAKRAGLYTVSLEAMVSSGNERELIEVMQPTPIIFEDWRDEEAPVVSVKELPKSDVTLPPTGTAEVRLHLLIVHKTDDQTPEMARMFVALRVGPYATYLAENGHTLFILSNRARDSDGRPSMAVETWRSHFADMKLPVFLIIEKETKKVLSCKPLPKTAIEVIESVVKAEKP